MSRFRIIALAILFIFRWRFPTNRSIADVIRNTYGDPTLKCMRKREKLDYKKRKLELDVNYLETCSHADIVPKFCQFRTSNQSVRNSRSYKICQKQLMVEELLMKKERLKLVTNEFEKCDRELFQILLYIDYVHITQIQSTHNKSYLN